jgi:hypothetical protein
VVEGLRGDRLGPGESVAAAAVADAMEAQLNAAQQH